MKQIKQEKISVINKRHGCLRSLISHIQYVWWSLTNCVRCTVTEIFEKKCKLKKTGRGKRLAAQGSTNTVKIGKTIIF